jgi:nicotinamide-nucleotide amidase
MGWCWMMFWQESMPTSFCKLLAYSSNPPSPPFTKGGLGGIIPEAKEGDVTMELEKTIGNLLRKKGRTLSIAESCTGGLICDRITNVSGSSDYFMGGMVTYSNASKAEHLGIPLYYIKRYGAVSPQVARRMAQEVRKALHTTFGLSTTGVAGPTGGTKRSPVGRVFIGFTNGEKAWVRKLDLKGNRREIKEKATEKALHFFYERLIHSGHF